MILLCIAAYCVDMNQSCHWANIVDIGGRYAAMAFGFMNMIGNIGNSVAPVTNERLFNLFGWDALFIPRGARRTFAEMTGDEKDRVSHRRRAWEALALKLPAGINWHAGKE